MSETTSSTHLTSTQLILIPTIITLAVTILRAVGEMQSWPKPWFSTDAGGGAAVIGISWLPLILGPYFAVKLARNGDGPASAGKSFTFPILGLAVLILGGFVSFKGAQAQAPLQAIMGFVIMAVGGSLCFPGWSALCKILLAYGLAARIPVAILMIFAISGKWGTHYDALPPGYNGPTGLWPKWVMIGLIPQMLLWVPLTIVVGSLFGAIAGAIARRGKPAMQTAS
ncbi:MAG TPA: hypothetical protein VG028_16130 [Terriglobia bacterium]|nr:hypothetical protein [Terriglobia bacterium]